MFTGNKDMRNLQILAAIALTVAACQTTTELEKTTQTVSLEAVQEVNTGAEILAMGGRKLSENEIHSTLVGKTLDEGSWTWSILENGKARSSANDGSWSSETNWYIKNDQYCRESPDFPRKCSDVYELSGFIRFSEVGDQLSSWTVQEKQ